MNIRFYNAKILTLKEDERLKSYTLVVTIMGNLGLEIADKSEKINLLKTKVGDRYILEEMLKENYILCVETE